MAVWYVVPAKRPLAESTLPMWKAAGYKIAVLLDTVPIMTAEPFDLAYFSVPIFGAYPGYARAVNALVSEVLQRDATCEWIVTGGDDITPDPAHSPEEIARECSGYFQLLNVRNALAEYTEARTDAHAPEYKYGPTFGVMQPTGDRYGDTDRHLGAFGSAYIDRVCGSPWLGREFCLRINQGHGPLWPGYFHMGCDEELQAISTKLGVLWQRPDL